MNWQKAYQAADFVFYCLLINVTVIIGALVGGIIFGLAPSVQAGFHVAKKTLKQESPPFFQTFLGITAGTFGDRIAWAYRSFSFICAPWW